MKKQLEARTQELAEARDHLAEALEQQTATSEVLQVISSSPTDVQAVFDTIVRSAVLLCGAMYGSAVRFDEVQARTDDLAESLSQQTATADVLKVISRSIYKPSLIRWPNLPSGFARQIDRSSVDAWVIPTQ